MKPTPHSSRQVWRDGQSIPDQVAEEVPLSLCFNGQPYVVMMASPTDLEDFVRGFCVTENIVRSPREIELIEVVELADGLRLDVQIPVIRAEALRPRNLQGRTGCGICGAQEIESVLRMPGRVPAGKPVRVSALRRVLENLPRHQPTNALTGAVHAAAWASADGLIDTVREDVGRHNALDKLIGRLLQEGRDLASGFCVVSSRASYEMVQKAAWVGMPMMIAVSAPTALAVRLAEDSGMTLVGFARENRHVIYSCPSRLRDD